MTLARGLKIAAYQAYFGAMVPVALPRLFTRLYEAEFYGEMHESWLDTFAIRDGIVAVDVGCGPGGFTRALAARGAQTTGFDRSERMLDAARGLSQGGDAPLSFVLADATELPLADQSAELVLCSSLLNIVPEPVLALRELRRVCKPGGTLGALFPGPEFTVDAAMQYAHDRGFSAGDTALLRLWAHSASKVAPREAKRWFADAGISETGCDDGLGGLVHTLAGTT